MHARQAFTQLVNRCAVCGKLGSKSINPRAEEFHSEIFYIEIFPTAAADRTAVNLFRVSRAGLTRLLCVASLCWFCSAGSAVVGDIVIV